MTGALFQDHPPGTGAQGGMERRETAAEKSRLEVAVVIQVGSGSSWLV